MDTVGVILGLAIVFGAYLRGQRQAARKLASKHEAKLGEVLQEISLLRCNLVAAGMVERSAQLPPPRAPEVSAPSQRASSAKSPPTAASSPASAKPSPLVASAPVLPSVARPVTVTRDDHPDHTRATVVAPAPGGGVESKGDEPPSTQPTTSRRISANCGGTAATAPISSPRPVSFDDQVRRALLRMENGVEVPPELEARWLARLRALGAELNISESEGPTDEQVEIMIRQLYEAEVDSKDARHAPAPRPALATLPSATAPIARRIATAARGPDMDGEATLLWGGAEADDDPADAGRDTGEDCTKVYSRRPGEADAQIPGVRVVPKPTTVRPPHPPPRKIGDPLAGAAVEVPTSSPPRTADAFRKGSRPTLFGGIGLGAVRGSAPRPVPGGLRGGEEEGGEAQ